MVFVVVAHSNEEFVFHNRKYFWKSFIQFDFYIILCYINETNAKVTNIFLRFQFLLVVQKELPYIFDLRKMGIFFDKPDYVWYSKYTLLLNDEIKLCTILIYIKSCNKIIFTLTSFFFATKINKTKI